MSYRSFSFESRNLLQAKTFSRKFFLKTGSPNCSSSITGIREKCLMKAPPNIPGPSPHSTPDGERILTPRIAELGDLLLKINPQRSSFSSSTSFFSTHFIIPSVWSIPVEIVNEARLFRVTNQVHGFSRYSESVFNLRTDRYPCKIFSEGYLLCSDCAGVLRRI